MSPQAAAEEPARHKCRAHELWNPHATTRPLYSIAHVPQLERSPKAATKSPHKEKKTHMSQERLDTDKNKHGFLNQIKKKKKDFIEQPKWWSRKTLNSPTLMSTTNSQLPVEQPSVKKTGNYPQRFSITKDVRASSLVAQTVKNLLPIQETRV